MTKRSSLGRNLSALLSSSSLPSINTSIPPNNISFLAIQDLQPGQYQPRSTMDEEALQELAQSIKQQGVLQPLLVRALSPDRYEIIAGERRWRASQLAGLDEIPVIIRQVDNETAMAMALIENLQREDLNALEQANAIARLSTEFALTHQEIATLLSKSRTSISNFLRLLSLPPEVLRLLEHGDLDMGHARALLPLETSQLIHAARLVVAKNLSVRETEQLVNRIKQGKIPEKESILPAFDLQPYSDRLSDFLQTPIRLKAKKLGGSIVIDYHSHEELETLINKITL